MVTIQDIARVAGVSKATVSRALSGKVFVREEVKARIMQAVADTGYRPNLLARNLSTNKTHSIGLVITNGLYNGPFFSSLVAALMPVKMTTRRRQPILSSPVSTVWKKPCLRITAPKAWRTTRIS